MISLKNLSKQLKLFLLVSVVFSLANFSYMFFILKAQLESNNILFPLILYVLFNFVYALFSIPFGILSDKIGRKKVLVFAYALFSVVCLGFAFFSSLVMFVVLFGLYGLVYSVIDSNQRAFVSDLSTERVRATALGAFHTLTGLAALPASLIAGLLWQINPSMSFVYAFVTSLVSVLLFLGFWNSFKE